MSVETPERGSPSSGAAPTHLVRRCLAFAAVALACASGLAAYLWHVTSRELQLQRAQAPITMTPIAALPGAALPAAPAGEPSAAAAASTAVADAASAESKLRPYLLYRSTALGASYGRLSASHLGALQGERLLAPLQCERVHFAAGRGVCLEAQRDLTTTYHAHLFDAAFKVTASFTLAGPPSRARMSPDGQRAAVTVFVTGHSYASTDFTTRISVIDAASGSMIAEDLESFTVERDGKAFKAADFNVWGVTFTRDSRQFYATLGTGGQTLLVRGDLGAKRMTVLREGVECPSLSPDNLRIAFKYRHERAPSGRITWGLSVLELASGLVTPLISESRNVDDQVERLGNDELLYAMPKDETRASA